MAKRFEIDSEIGSTILNIVSKNGFVLTFSILTLITILFGSGLSFGVSYLEVIIGLFPSGLWYILALMLMISAILAYYEKWSLMFLPLVIWLLFTTAIIRTSNIDQLVNAATSEPILGPDLDPYLFTRNAIEISQRENMGPLDQMRGAPVGGPSYIKGNLMPWAIFGVYKTANIFTDYSVMEAAIISPVIFFLISIIGIFLFTYFLFSFKLSKKNALTGATISSFFYAFVPAMLHRTVAGIPELESLGMLWFWFAFLFFVLAWKQNFVSSKKIKNFFTNNKKLIFYGLLAGLFTGAMSWTWGGYKYIYLVIVSTSFLAFLFEKEKSKNYLIYISWFIPAIILELIRKGFGALTSITDTGLAVGVFILMLANLVLFNTKLKNKLKLEKINLPKPIITILITILLGILLLFISNPSGFIDFISDIFTRFFKPFGDTRVGGTVAENRVSYFTEALSSFGNLIWLFLAGIVVLFYESTKHFDKWKKAGLNLFFIIFILSFSLSSISSSHVLNGTSFISKFMYLGGLIVFGLFLIYTYSKAYKENDEKTLEDFRKIKISYIILIIFSLVGLMFMRTAIRFFFLVGPPLILGTSYLTIKLGEYYKHSKDDLIKVISFFLFVLTIIILIGTSISYIQGTKVSAQNTVPSSYHQQWHYAMDWVDQNTPEDAIFAHWWDYGYWVQTLGGRATVADGGHPAPGRNELLGRYMLTTSNPKTALAFMNSLEVDYLLIDSSDVGKYGAFSLIGSDETGKDRRSWIPVMPLDPSQTQEINGTIKNIFGGGTVVDLDIIYTQENGEEIFLPAERAGLAAISIEYTEQNGEVSFQQPEGIFVYNNQRYDIPLKYIYFQGEIIDFGEGIESLVRIVPSLQQNSQGVSVNQIGAAVYLSEKTKDTLFSQLYLLNDPENRYPTLSVAHSEDDFVIKSLKQQGLDLGDFIYYQGLRGPIKIWEVNYPEGTPKHEEYLQPYNWDANNSWGELDYFGE
ncbi:MAG: STT3 domain-containing protein [Candidatus Pacearchaeota archaeon]